MRQVYGMNDDQTQIVINKLNFNEFEFKYSLYDKNPNKKEILNIFSRSLFYS